MMIPHGHYGSGRAMISDSYTGTSNWLQIDDAARSEERDVGVTHEGSPHGDLAPRRMACSTDEAIGPSAMTGRKFCFFAIKSNCLAIWLNQDNDGASEREAVLCSWGL